MEGKQLLDQGLTWSVGNGEDINFWGDNWIPNQNEGKVLSPPPEDCVLNKVFDFIEKPSMKWDEAKVRTCVSQEESQAILKIPINIINSLDRRVWGKHKSGKYSVKSGYFHAHKAKGWRRAHQASSSYAVPEKVWRKLWSIPTIPQVRHFVWRIAQNWIASKENLFWKKCSHTSICPICEKESESIEHTLFRCPWTEAVWFGSGLIFRTRDQSITMVGKWIEELLRGGLAKETSPERVGLIFQVCWAIWKTRNDCIFNGNIPRPENTIVMARTANSDYLLAVFKDSAECGRYIKMERETKWCPPQEGVPKFNCDEAYQSSHSKTAFWLQPEIVVDLLQFGGLEGLLLPRPYLQKHGH